MADSKPCASVLVVEDSPTQAKNVLKLLKSFNFKVAVASNGEEALSLISDHDFDLVVSDVLMPRMNGYELCRRLKADSSTRHLPVLLVTSLNGEMDKARGMEAGADAFLTKPYHPRDFQAQIMKLLGQSGKKLENIMSGE
jgi:twitching motility two-component system response regulator PilH